MLKKIIDKTTSDNIFISSRLSSKVRLRAQIMQKKQTFKMVLCLAVNCKLSHKLCPLTCS